MMRYKYYSIGIAFVITCFLVPTHGASAHQPVIVSTPSVQVLEPEISRAFYDELKGLPRLYVITSERAFELYVNILAPYAPTSSAPFSFTVSRLLNGELYRIAQFEGASSTWQRYFEPFGHDYYLKGPEYKAMVTSGTYWVEVRGVEEDVGRYTLAIGEKEQFSPADMWSALVTIPVLKRDFFGASPFTFLLSPLGYGLVIILFILAWVVSWVYYRIKKKWMKPETASEPRGWKNRMVWFGFFVVLSLLGIYTWNPILLFMAGLSLYQIVAKT